MTTTSKKLELQMEWGFIKDKYLELLDGSDEQQGVILILDSEDEVVRIIGYELIKDK